MLEREGLGIVIRGNEFGDPNPGSPVAVQSTSKAKTNKSTTGKKRKATEEVEVDNVDGEEQDEGSAIEAAKAKKKTAGKGRNKKAKVAIQDEEPAADEELETETATDAKKSTKKVTKMNTKEVVQKKVKVQEPENATDAENDDIKPKQARKKGRGGKAKLKDKEVEVEAQDNAKKTTKKVTAGKKGKVSKEAARAQTPAPTAISVVVPRTPLTPSEKDDYEAEDEVTQGSTSEDAGETEEE